MGSHLGIRKFSKLLNKKFTDSQQTSTTPHFTFVQQVSKKKKKNSRASHLFDLSEEKIDLTYISIKRKRLKELRPLRNTCREEGNLCRVYSVLSCLVSKVRSYCPDSNWLKIYFRLYLEDHADH